MRRLRNCCVRIRFAHGQLDEVMCGCKRTRGIRHRCVPGEQKGLTTASAEIFRAAIATAARLRHPLFTAESLERRRLLPDPFQCLLAHVLKRQSGQHFRRMTRQNFARWIDQHQSSSPASHARLRILRIVVRNDRIDAHPAGEPLLGLRDDGDRPLQLRARRHQRRAIR